jgi:hypothetical protein
MSATCSPLLEAGNHLLGNVSHDELCHIDINDSMDTVQESPNAQSFPQLEVHA